MPGTILVRDVLYRVSVQLLDTSPQFVRWTERELVAWLNDAQRAVAKYLPHSCARVDAVKLQAGTRQSIHKILAANILPGDGTAATDVLGAMVQDVVRNMGANGSTPGAPIRIIDRETLDLNRPDWHTATSTSVACYVFDPRTPLAFWVYPALAAPTWVELSYLAKPPEITSPGAGTLYGVDGASAAVISIDDQYVDDLVNYVLARAHMKDAESAGNLGLANAYISAFTSSLNAQAAALTGVNPNLKSLPMTPALPATAS